MKHIMSSIRSYLALTLLLGILYPLVMTGVSKTIFPKQAEGSLIQKDGKLVGSKLIAQKFTDPKYFWPRPSSGDYNPLPSGGTNLGPTSGTLQKAINDRKSQGLSGDLLFASGSGLDPHISPGSALSQVDRVASSRGLSVDKVRAIVQQQIEKRDLGFLGEEKVNVLELNISMDRAQRDER